MQFQRQRFQIRACPGCGLRFLDPQPTQAELDHLYGEAYFAGSSTAAPGYDRYVDEIENHRRTFAERMRFLPAPAPGDRLLDVGASIGVFVEQARQAGWDAEGLEPSEWAASFAREQLGQPVRTGVVHREVAPAGHYQMITMWEVVEHLSDPAMVLADLHHLLAPGGILALSTPDAGSLVTRLMGRRWPGWQKIPEHLFFFDRRTLDRVLRGTGLEPFDWRHVTLTVSRRYLWDRVARLMPLPPRHWLPARWMEQSIRVNPGYDLMVMARRPA
ncbi:MAG: class I SAM-dependent methyltransferase [Gemmatimonadota bacterium]|nr:class I SAM-dependent methyltransferase [Gemmatimonadota bacterium]